MTERCLNFVLNFVIPHEGEDYEDDKDDPGGATKYGIDQRSHPNVDIRNLTKEQACSIYYDSYWTPNRCEKLASSLGECHMDAAVNTGSKRAKRFLASSHNDPKEYNNERIAFYQRLVNARPVAKKYLRGWTNRVKDLNEFLGIS